MNSKFGMGISFAKALRIEHGAVVSFVGGGGKTSSMFRLASELCAAGLRVITTTTTHIGEEQVDLAPTSITLSDIALLGARLDLFGTCLVIGPPDGKGRVTGPSLELIAKLSKRSDVDAILVEADGSRSRPFKAPGENEPVVPEVTTLLAPLVGLDAIGLSLDEDHIHRSEVVAALARQKMGSSVTPETVARVLSHPEGGAKKRPPGARLVPVLNRADIVTANAHVAGLAERLLTNRSVDSVIVSAMNEDPPVREAWVPTAGIVLAAGMATRFGSTKQILPWKETSLVAHSVTTALEAGLDPVVAVIGYDADRVEKALTGLSVKIVSNPDFASGQSTSIRRGLGALPSRTGAAMFLLADQPLVTADLLRMIMCAHRRTLAPACVPVFDGRRGNPVLFDGMLFSELCGLRGDAGGRTLLEKHRDDLVAVPAGRAALMDIDTPEDYEQFIRTAPNL
jgi:molybdenum cofactor cytidylyltransferase